MTDSMENKISPSKKNTIALCTVLARAPNTGLLMVQEFALPMPGSQWQLQSHFYRVRVILVCTHESVRMDTSTTEISHSLRLSILDCSFASPSIAHRTKKVFLFFLAVVTFLFHISQTALAQLHGS